MLNAHKNLATVKALEEKVGPTIEGLQKIVEMDLGNLTTVKEAVQASDAGSILVALRKAGRSEKADQLNEILEKVFDWADSAFTSGFKLALRDVTDKFGSEICFPASASYEEKAALFTGSLPTLPPSVDQSFMLHRFRAESLIAQFAKMLRSSCNENSFTATDSHHLTLSMSFHTSFPGKSKREKNCPGIDSLPSLIFDSLRDIAPTMTMF